MTLPVDIENAQEWVVPLPVCLESNGEVHPPPVPVKKKYGGVGPSCWRRKHAGRGCAPPCLPRIQREVSSPPPFVLKRGGDGKPSCFTATSCQKTKQVRKKDGRTFAPAFPSFRDHVVVGRQGGTGIGKTDPGSNFFLRPPWGGLTKNRPGVEFFFKAPLGWTN
jgi:hypothetical protein